MGIGEVDLVTRPHETKPFRLRRLLHLRDRARLRVVRADMQHLDAPALPGGPETNRGGFLTATSPPTPSRLGHVVSPDPFWYSDEEAPAHGTVRRERPAGTFRGLIDPLEHRNTEVVAPLPLEELEGVGRAVQRAEVLLELAAPWPALSSHRKVLRIPEIHEEGPSGRTILPSMRPYQVERAARAYAGGHLRPPGGPSEVDGLRVRSRRVDEGAPRGG